MTWGRRLAMRGSALFLAAVWGGIGCNPARPNGSNQGSAGASASASPARSSDAPGALGSAPPTPRQGMAWIPGGALVAGTPPDAVPRLAGEEMAGEQIILKGFYMDVYQYPNEEGGIPLTSVDFDTASRLCQAQDKRLCTELEWERACKGPLNRMYEYGDVYDPERCGTGGTQRIMPSGLLVGCRSDFGPRDMHGAAWEWTQSDWRRSGAEGRKAVRGGDGRFGDVVARCANRAARAIGTQAADLGFRCCAGAKNTAEVNVTITSSAGFEGNTSVDALAVRQVMEDLPEQERLLLGDPTAFRITRSWSWRPVSNEDLVVFGGCTGLGSVQRCGVVVGRRLLGRVAFAAWAASGEWLPSLHAEYTPRDVWLTGGTKAGTFRRLLHYSYGRVQVGHAEAALRHPPPPRKRRKKTQGRR